MADTRPAPECWRKARPTRIGVPKETAEGERRVALVPEVVGKLSGGEGGIEVVVRVAPPSVEEIGRLGSETVLIGFCSR